MHLSPTSKLGYLSFKVAIFLMPTGTLRKIMTFLRKITVCSSLMPPLENKLRLKYSKHPRINTTFSCSM